MLPMPNLDTPRNTNYQEAKQLTRKLQQAGQATQQPLKVVRNLLVRALSLPASCPPHCAQSSC